jgi:hypothetical protein
MFGDVKQRFGTPDVLAAMGRHGLREGGTRVARARLRRLANEASRLDAAAEDLDPEIAS